MLLLSIFVNGETNFGDKIGENKINSDNNNDGFPILPQPPGTTIGDYFIGIANVYAKSTASPSATNYVKAIPNCDTPRLVTWYFDGTHMPGTEKPYSLFSILNKPVKKLEGPQKGFGIIFVGGSCMPDDLTLKGFGIFICWNYTETVPDIYPKHPGINDKNISVKTNFSWDLTESYDGEEQYIIYTVKIIFPDMTSHIFEVEGKKYLDLKKEDFTLKYNTTYGWEISGYATDLDEHMGAQEPAPWAFTTTRDLNSPNKPEWPSPSDGSTCISKNNIRLSWLGGDLDEYDSVHYTVYLNNSTVLDENSIVPGYTTIYYPWNHSLIPVILSEITNISLDSKTKYYWKVVAEDLGGNKNEGDRWEFTTGA